MSKNPRSGERTAHARTQPRGAAPRGDHDGQAPAGVQVSRAPDPVRPLRARGVDYWAADSSMWVNVPQAPLWQVVALSLDIEPVSLNTARREFCPPAFCDRLDMAWANCGTGLPACEDAGTAISMRDFGDWALALPRPLDLPEWFPRTPAAAASSAPRQKAASSPQAARGRDDASKGESNALNKAKWKHLDDFKREAVKQAREKTFKSRAEAARTAADMLQDKPNTKSKRYDWTTVDRWLKAAGWSAKMTWDNWVAYLDANAPGPTQAP